MKKETFEKLVIICREYDPYTQYIDSYAQKKQAERRNEELDKQFNELVHEVQALSGYDGGIPWRVANKGADTAIALREWMYKHEVREGL